MILKNSEIFVFHDNICNIQAQALRQDLALHGVVIVPKKKSKNILFIVVYGSSDGYEQIIQTVRMLDSKYPVLAIPIDANITVFNTDSVIFVPYNFDMIIQTIKTLIPLKKEISGWTKFWRCILILLWIALSIAPIWEAKQYCKNRVITRYFENNLYPVSQTKIEWNKGSISLLSSKTDKNTYDYYDIIELIFAGFIYLVSYVTVLIYLVSYCQRYRQRQSIDNLKLRILTLTDSEQRKKVSERLLNFYLEDSEKQ